MRLRRGAVALMVAGMLAVLSACGSVPSLSVRSPSVSPTPTSSGPLQWGSCPAGLGISQVQCAQLKVPLDYANPSGQQITLELSRRLHTSSESQYLGAMLADPGGPGGSGLVMPIYSTRVPNGVGGRFDWIGWDPRGVGASEPALTCESNYFDGDRPPYNDAADQQIWLQRASDYAKACGKDQPALLQHMTTEDNARDMDMIRQALGQQKISYYGFSWGSYLGQVYITLFPDRVNRVVLDGVVNPSRGWYGANMDQDVAFEKVIKLFFAWIARNDAVYHLGTTEAAVYAAFDKELATLSRTPAGNGVLGPDELIDTILNAGYVASGWPENAAMLSRLINQGDGSDVLSAYEQKNAGADNENQYAVYNAVQCTDMKWPGWPQTLADTQKLNATSPFETWSNTWYNAPCLTWPAAAHTPVTIKAAPGLPKILMIAETFDAATPFSGALAARQLFTTASLIEGVDGTTHAGSLNGVPCTDDVIARYLATGNTPVRKSGNGSDLQCPPNPIPPASMS